MIIQHTHSGLYHTYPLVKVWTVHGLAGETPAATIAGRMKVAFTDSAPGIAFTKGSPTITFTKGA